MIAHGITARPDLADPFQALRHLKAVLAETTKPDLKLLYPPYTDEGLKIMGRILG
jgi:aldehyde dehydrogenase (NAD+)